MLSWNMDSYFGKRTSHRQIEVARMNKKTMSVMLLCFVSLLSACGGSRSETALVEYHRSGGFAGIDDHLVVYPDGRATLTRKGVQAESQLSSDDLSSLDSVFTAAGFTSLNRQYLPSGGADLIEYTITYQGHTVQAVDTAIPPELQPVLQVLDQLIESVSPD